MLKRPVQLLRIFTLLVVGFVGLQVLQILKIKNSEISYSKASFIVSQQQLLVRKIYFAMERYRSKISDENLIVLNAQLSLFKKNQKLLVNELQAFDSENYIISGSLNDKVLDFVNDTERYKQSTFDLEISYLDLANQLLPLEYHRLLNGLLAQGEKQIEDLERKVTLLIFSLLALVLQSFLLLFAERDLTPRPV
jgi:hypothetical protein